MSKVKQYFYINDNKQRVTVSLDNESQGVIATLIVEKIETDSTGYTTAIHEVFKDFFKRIKVGQHVKRVTKKVRTEWETLIPSVFKEQLPLIKYHYNLP